MNFGLEALFGYVIRNRFFVHAAADIGSACLDVLENTRRNLLVAQEFLHDFTTRHSCAQTRIRQVQRSPHRTGRPTRPPRSRRTDDSGCRARLVPPYCRVWIFAAVQLRAILRNWRGEAAVREVPNVSDLGSFYEYVQAFELAYLSDDWSLIQPFFADDARHVVTDGGPHDRDDRGAADIVAGFRQAVRDYDHRFDMRLPEIIDGPVTRDDGVWMKFRLTMCRRGLPDLTIEGEHLTRYEDGKIVAIKERVFDGAGDSAGSYLVTHAAELRPPDSPVGEQAYPERRSELDRAVMKSLVRCYGAAKSETDIEAALKLCHPDFRCETVCFGSTTRDKADTAVQFGLFFDTFPNYVVHIDGLIAEGEHVSCWGRQSLTLDGNGLGVPPTGRTAVQDFACVFAFRDNAIVREIYYFDLADMCEQLDVPIGEVKTTLALLRSIAA